MAYSTGRIEGSILLFHAVQHETDVWTINNIQWARFEMISQWFFPKRLRQYPTNRHI